MDIVLETFKEPLQYHGQLTVHYCDLNTAHRSEKTFYTAAQPVHCNSFLISHFTGRLISERHKQRTLSNYDGHHLQKCKAKQHMLACGFVRWIQSLSRKSWSDLKAAHGFVLHMHERMTSEVTGIVPPQVKIQSLSNHPCQRKGRVMFCGPQNTSGTSQQNSEAAFSQTTQWWVLLKRDLDYTGDAVFFFFGFGSPERKNWFNKTLCTCFLQGKNLLS